MIVEFGKLQDIRRQHVGQRLVMVGGAFDLFHPGHLSYLKTAMTYGDVVVAMVVSNERVRSLKGLERPVIHHDGRAEIIDAIKGVDYVFVAPGAVDKSKAVDPVFRDVFVRLQPDVFVTTNSTWAEFTETFGATILKLLPRPEGHSTTRTIKHIQQHLGAAPLE